jgi:hypothetical protein
VSLGLPSTPLLTGPDFVGTTAGEVAADTNPRGTLTIASAADTGAAV